MTNNTIPIKPLSSSTTTPKASPLGSTHTSGRANDKVHEQLQRLTNALESIVLGKPTQIRLAVACLLARGHLLIEDLPGMGKTLLSHAIAISLGLSYNRVQFTSDVLPADILGASIFDRNTGEFRFVEGPLFAQVVLADEINRATPKSQSALLEAMEERQVTSEGTTRQLPDPFFVLATQNPSTQTGTFPLPESQLDRFLMRIELGYPEPEAERELLRGGDRRELLKDMKPAIDLAELKSLQQAVSEVKASDLLIDYIQRVVNHSRVAPEFAFGLSPRGSLALLGASKAWALLHQRTHVVPEDVQAVLPSVVEHRLREAADFAGHGGAALAHKLLTSVDVVG